MPAEVLTSRIEREIFLRTFLRGPKPPPGMASIVIGLMREEHYQPGAIIYREGANPEFIHYVVRGKVELRTAGKPPWSFGEHSAIGGLDAFQGQGHSRTAVAVEETLILKVPIEDYFELMEDNFDFAKTMMTVLFTGVEEVSTKLNGEIVYPPDDPLPLQLAIDSQLGLVERLIVLRNARALRRVRLQVLVRLAQLAEEQRLAPGNFVWSRGEQAEAYFAIASGRVFAARNEPSIGAEFGPGSVIAPLAAFSNQEQLYEARALTPLLVLRVRKGDFWDVMEDHADLARAMLGFGAAERARLQTAIAGALQEVPRVSVGVVRAG